MACISTALLVGGGIAGLSAAIALSRIGVRCEVIELSETSLGASLGLSGRAAEALDELGVYDEGGGAKPPPPGLGGARPAGLFLGAGPPPDKPQPKPTGLARIEDGDWRLPAGPHPDLGPGG